MSGELSRRAAMVSARVLTDEDVKVMEIEREMFPHLDAEQSRRLHSALERVLIPPPPYMDNDQFVAAFAEAKRVQGCSERTTKYYAAELARASKVVGKPWERWTSDDARSYMSWSFSHGSNETTVNNKYRVLSTFFMWMEGEEYVPRSVMRKVSQVKVPRRRRKPFTSVEVDAMRSACRDDRERTVLEMLLSSGVRANELVTMRVSECDVERRRATVIGKGDKEREVYFSEVAQTYLRRYLSSRADDIDLVVVSKNRVRGEFRPLGVSGLEIMVREIGKRAGVKNVHPHRFRHTMATDLLRRGMPLEDIKELLGHEKIETTLVYAEIDHENVMNNARRLIG